jgi:hypothetical protein
MRVGFDLDGTAWKYRELFVLVASALKNKGIQIGIVTLHRGLREPDIKLWLARGFPPIDFYYSVDEYPTLVAPTVQLWKQTVCKLNNIDYLFDDFESDEIKLIGI